MAPMPQDLDKLLSVGVNPFSCGHFPDQQGTPILARAQNYDLMTLGLTAPTLAEQATFCTVDVNIPSTVYAGGLMLEALTIILDVLLGPNNAISRVYFCWTPSTPPCWPA
jgi:hypothetical protein